MVSSRKIFISILSLIPQLGVIMSEFCNAS